MSEIIQTINALLERYMSKKSADIVKCVIVGAIGIGLATALIVPICISTLGCQIFYGIVIAIITLATMWFIIKIIKSEIKDETTSQHQTIESGEPASSPEANGRLLVEQNESENTTPSGAYDPERELRNQSAVSNTRGTTTGVRITADDRSRIRLLGGVRVEVEGDSTGDTIGVDGQARGGANITCEDTIHVQKKN